MATRMVWFGNRAVPWWRRRILTALVAGLLLLGTCCWGLWNVAANTVTVWEIPADFRGWAVLEWDNPTCSELPRRRLSRIVTVDATGYACTAHRPEDVPSGMRTFLVYPDGRREELRSQDYAYDGVQVYFGFTAYRGNGSQQYDATFIGTANGFRADPYPTICTRPVRVKRACIPR